jgi:isopentenyl-diphosphate delta-isomerase
VSRNDDSNGQDVIRRKEEGIDVVLKKNVQAKETSTLLECVHLVHNALPELDMGEIDTSVSLLGHKLKVPIIVDSMTGGAPIAEKVNGILASVAEEMGFGMGVGSQRAGLLSDEMARTYSITRANAPSIFLFANIGAAQLAKGFSLEDAKKLVEMIRADALAVHLNPLQEVVQPEGEQNFKGVLARIKELSSGVGVPVIVKEVGAGISKEIAVRLEMAGAKAINVSGAGGTSWAAVEMHRAESRSMDEKVSLGEVFWDWGIPTAAALVEVKRAVRVPVIASGGIRNGLDVAKCLSLGADACGLASPMLKAAIDGVETLKALARDLVLQLKTAMLVTGSGNVQSLRNVRKVITPPLSYWVGS